MRRQKIGRLRSLSDDTTDWHTSHCHSYDSGKRERSQDPKPPGRLPRHLKARESKFKFLLLFFITPAPTLVSPTTTTSSKFPSLYHPSHAQLDLHATNSLFPWYFSQSTNNQSVDQCSEAFAAYVLYKDHLIRRLPSSQIVEVVP